MRLVTAAPRTAFYISSTLENLGKYHATAQKNKTALKSSSVTCTTLLLRFPFQMCGGINLRL
jgi:hypothetical protein